MDYWVTPWAVAEEIKLRASTLTTGQRQAIVDVHGAFRERATYEHCVRKARTLTTPAPSRCSPTIPMA
jgi:hypothetical protein